MNAEKKKMKKQKVSKGIDKIKKANKILNLEEKQPSKPNSFKIEVKGKRQDAFQASHFKLFE